MTAEVIRIQQRAVEFQASFTETPTPEPAIRPRPQFDDPPTTMQTATKTLNADADRRIAEADAAMDATAEPFTKLASRDIPMTGDEQRRSAWSSAMADIAHEVTVQLPGLAPGERRAAGMRAAAPSTAANDLLGSSARRP